MTCYAVDYGSYHQFAISGLRIHPGMYWYGFFLTLFFLFLEIIDASVKWVKTGKSFKDHPYTLRCCLGAFSFHCLFHMIFDTNMSFVDVNNKPFTSFPMSRTGLRLAFCGKNSPEDTTLKVCGNFVSYLFQYVLDSISVV